MEVGAGTGGQGCVARFLLRAGVVRGLLRGGVANKRSLFDKVSRGFYVCLGRPENQQGGAAMKRYQYIDYFAPLDEPFGYPVLADYGEEGPSVGADAVWAWRVTPDGEIEGFDPHDGLRWGKNSAVEAEFDDLDGALAYLRREVERRFRS